MSQPGNPLHKELSPAEKQARKLADRAKKKKDAVYKMRKRTTPLGTQKTNMGARSLLECHTGRSQTRATDYPCCAYPSLLRSVRSFSRSFCGDSVQFNSIHISTWSLVPSFLEIPSPLLRIRYHGQGKALEQPEAIPPRRSGFLENMTFLKN